MARTSDLASEYVRWTPGSRRRPAAHVGHRFSSQRGSDVKRDRAYLLPAHMATALLLLLAIHACSDDMSGPGTPTEPPARSQLMLQSSAGLAVPADRMEANLKELTRGIAMALEDPALRGLVYSEFHSSPVREGKLHLRSFITGRGEDLLREVSLRTEVTQHAILQKLDSVFDLEFYMPVDAHRDQWDGGSDLLVATVMRDDGTIPTAFDVLGRQVVLRSAVTPPAIPTLAVVRAETDFARAGAEREPGASGVTSASMSSGDGVYMTRAFIADDFEGFLMGDPEFEMHVFAGGGLGHTG